MIKLLIQNLILILLRLYLENKSKHIIWLQLYNFTIMHIIQLQLYNYAFMPIILILMQKINSKLIEKKFKN